MKHINKLIVLGLAITLFPSCASNNKRDNSLEQMYYQQQKSVEVVSVKLEGDNSKITLEGKMTIAISQPIQQTQYQQPNKLAWLSPVLDVFKLGTGLYFGERMLDNSLNAASKPPVIVEQQIPFLVPTAP